MDDPIIIAALLGSGGALLGGMGKALQGAADWRKARFDIKQARKEVQEESDRKIKEAKDTNDAIQIAADARAKHEEINVLAVAHKVLELLENETLHGVDPDLSAHMATKFKMANTDEMQELWARVFAQEITKPGVFSKRDVDEIARLSKEEANVFAQLTRHVWHVSGTTGPIPTLVLNEEEAFPLYVLDNVLRRTGLIEDHLFGVGSHESKEGSFVDVRYFGRRCKLEVLKLRQTMNISGDNRIVLTPLGESMSSIVSREAIPGEFEKRVKEWREGDLFKVVFAEGMTENSG